MTNPVVHLSVSIARPPAEVYAFVRDPRNLPSWAAGVGSSGTLESGAWVVADSPMGRIALRFVPENAYGVLDHVVTLPDGTSVLNPMRVLPNADGSELLFSLFRLPGVSDAAFEADARAVRQDLARLKALLEGRG
ncbi:MAG: SRPBCC family protein [Myxococcales bacterium]